MVCLRKLHFLTLTDNRLTLLVGLIFLSLSCKNPLQESPSHQRDPPKPVKSNPTEETKPDGKDSVTSLGRVSHYYGSSKKYESYRMLLQEIDSLKTFSDALNDKFNWPSDLVISTKECGRINAYYYPSEQEINICYELLEFFRTQANRLDGTQQEKNEAFRHSVNFVVLHEIGHAAIHIFDIPFTGREEDSADQFAAWYTIKFEGNVSMRLASVAFYKFSLLGKTPYWAEHALAEQRAYNTYCWAYGADPFANIDLVNMGYLPVSRAERCGKETKQLLRNWDKLLKQHMK